jgi:hypothetical protein
MVLGRLFSYVGGFRGPSFYLLLALDFDYRLLRLDRHFVIAPQGDLNK